MLWQPQHYCSRFTPAAALGNLPALPNPSMGGGDGMRSVWVWLHHASCVTSTPASAVVDHISVRCVHPHPSRKVWPPLRVAPDLCCSDTCCMCAAVLVAALMLISAAPDLCCGYSCRIIAAVLLQAKAGLTMSQHCNVEVGSLSFGSKHLQLI